MVTKELWFSRWWGQGILLLSPSILTDAHLLSYSWEIRLFSLEIKRMGHHGDSCSVLPMLGLCGAVCPCSHTPEWHVQGQLYLYHVKCDLASRPDRVRRGNLKTWEVLVLHWSFNRKLLILYSYHSRIHKKTN